MAKKQKSGLYRTKMKIGVDADGKNIVKWISARTQRELEQKKQQLVDTYILGTGLREDRVFGELAVEWYRVVKSPTMSASSLESYRTALNKDILPVFGDRKLRSILPAELQRFVYQFAGKSATKITVVLATLRGVFEEAVAQRLLNENPMQHVRRPAARPPAEKLSLTDEERRKIEELCASHPYGHYLALMYYLGVRPGEARGFQWGDIDWKTGRIHVQRDLDYKAGAKLGDLKTYKSDRVIPMPEPLRAILSPLRGMPELLIVRGEKGEALSKASAERIWIRMMLECGMAVPKENPKSQDIRARYTPKITLHALRHNFATLCWRMTSTSSPQ